MRLSPTATFIQTGVTLVWGLLVLVFENPQTILQTNLLGRSEGLALRLDDFFCNSSRLYHVELKPCQFYFSCSLLLSCHIVLPLIEQCKDSTYIRTNQARRITFKIITIISPTFWAQQTEGGSKTKRIKNGAERKLAKFLFSKSNHPRRQLQNSRGYIFGFSKPPPTNFYNTKCHPCETHHVKNKLKKTITWCLIR